MEGEIDAIIFLIDFIKIQKRISNSLYMYKTVNKFNLKNLSILKTNITYKTSCFWIQSHQNCVGGASTCPEIKHN